MKRIGLLLILSFLFSCNQPEPRAPLNKKQNSFLINSAARNKRLLETEEQLLLNSADKDSLLRFEKSASGFLYAYKVKALQTLPLPKKGTPILFSYQIEDLEQNMIYDKQTLGVVEYSLDQEEILPALRLGLRMMKAGEVVVFLFPSYLCYSYQGDGDKIGVNQPLRFTIERIDRP